MQSVTRWALVSNMFSLFRVVITAFGRVKSFLVALKCYVSEYCEWQRRLEDVKVCHKKQVFKKKKHLSSGPPSKMEHFLL